ncbi:MAG: hypothetical protein ABR548_14845 [Actinomycetota bacterium]|nr:hypothetical protein [Actinomycetota bacterium]
MRNRRIWSQILLAAAFASLMIPLPGRAETVLATCSGRSLATPQKADVISNCASADFTTTDASTPVRIIISVSADFTGHVDGTITPYDDASFVSADEDYVGGQPFQNPLSSYNSEADRDLPPGTHWKLNGRASGIGTWTVTVVLREA